MNENPQLKDIVRQTYGAAAARVARGGGGGSGCCGSAPAAGAQDTADTGCCNPITSNLYRAGEAGAVPAQALQASLGCGNPTALAELKPGETVLDLGSGGGIDVLLSARRVGPTGRAFTLSNRIMLPVLAREHYVLAGGAAVRPENAAVLTGLLEGLDLR